MSGIGVGFFHASAGERVRISNQSTGNNTLAGTGGTAVATYRLSNSGTASKTNPASGSLVSISGEWLVSGAVGDYEVKGTWSGTGGVVNGPTTFSSLSTTRDFTLSVSNNFVQRDLTVEIRDASTLTVLDTAVISFSIDSAP